MSNIQVNFGDILPETSKNSGAFWDLGVDRVRTAGDQNFNFFRLDFNPKTGGGGESEKFWISFFAEA